MGRNGELDLMGKSKKISRLCFKPMGDEEAGERESLK